VAALAHLNFGMARALEQQMGVRIYQPGRDRSQPRVDPLNGI
jgi:hypothetical protein